MALTPGSRLGPYEIVSRLGAGGMGEVFRARDTRLDRSVAIKILPAASGAMKARFEREAKTISQLNHPHICTLHDVGQDNGTSYLVMELVEGDTLASRIARGALPLPDVVRYGSQIAAALDRAHRAGVVHRDLKPANVMITKSGAKLLDFGLARPARAAVLDPDAPTQQGPITAEGTIVGTVPYMAPEQLQGHEADPRTDLFALGAVLYEMITGRRAFDAKSSVSLVAQILERDPPAPSTLQPVTPPTLEHVIMTCLEKDPEARYQCAADIGHALRAIGADSRRTLVDAPLPAAPATRRVKAAVAAVALLAIAGAAGLAYRIGRRTAAPVESTFAQLTFDAGEETQPTLAPDGKMFAFVRVVDGQRDIFLQRVDGRSAINLTKENRTNDGEPAFSPNGEQIAFRSERDGGGIFVMGATGESVRRLTDGGFNPNWSPDGKEIVYGTERVANPRLAYGTSELHVVSVATGASRKLYAADARLPAWSPHGHRIAFFATRSRSGHRNVFTIDRSGDPASLVPVTSEADLTNWNPVWSPEGDSLYFVSDRNGIMNVWRVPIDEKSGQVTGPIVPVHTPAADAGWITIARGTGQMLYQATSRSGELLRVAFDPATERLLPDAAPFFSGSTQIRHFAPSQDGRWIAFTTSQPPEDLYVMAASGTDVRQLTRDPARERGTSWSPDSSRILFYSTRDGKYYGYSIRPDGSGLARLTAGDEVANWPRLSRDGRFLSYIRENADGSSTTRIADAHRLPVTSGEPVPPTPHGPFEPVSWSPDGTRVAGVPWGPAGSGMYVYSLASKRLSSVGVDAADCAFIDDHRILFITRSDDAGVVDVATGATRMIGRVPAGNGTTAGHAFSTDGRILVLYRARSESDVWLMSPRVSARSE